MAKIEDKFVKKVNEFVVKLKSPKGFWQKSLRLGVKLFAWCFILPLSKFYPLSVGADQGTLFRLRNQGKYQEAVEFGLMRLSKTASAKPDGKWSIRRWANWFLLDQTIQCACSLDTPSFDAEFKVIIDTMGIESKGTEISGAFCSMAKLYWRLNKRDECWEWIERAVAADKEYGYAHYLKGWFEVHLEKGNPVESLFMAVSKEPDLLRMMRKDEALICFPDFIAAVDARARQARIYVV